MKAPSRRDDDRRNASARSPVRAVLAAEQHARRPRCRSRTAKAKPSASSSSLSVGEVLDDAVVDDGEPAVVAEVRVRVAVGRAAVRRPAGVADAGRAVAGSGWPRGRRSAPTACRPSCAVSSAPSGVDHGDTGGVVAAVLETLQAAEEHLETLVGTDVPHDSTHATRFYRGPHTSETASPMAANGAPRLIHS